MAEGRHVRLKLFLEGVEVPVIGATVTFGVNIPASATISIVPSPVIRKFKDRTLVHLFFLDDTELFYSGSKSNQGKYKLLFAGEVRGYRFIHSQYPAVMLFCQDFSSYLDQVKRFFYDFLSFNYEQSIMSTFLGGQKMSYDFVFGPGATLASLIKRPCRTYPKLKGVLASIIRLIESVGGYHEGVVNTRGVSLFHTLAQLRLKFYQQIGAPEEDVTSQRLLNSAEFYNWVNAFAARGGNTFSLRELIMNLLSIIYYSWISNPLARYVVTEPITTKTKSGTVNAKFIKSLNLAAKMINNVIKVIVPPLHTRIYGFVSYPHGIEPDEAATDMFSESGVTLSSIPLITDYPQIHAADVEEINSYLTKFNTFYAGVSAPLCKDRVAVQQIINILHAALVLINSLLSKYDVKPKTKTITIQPRPRQMLYTTVLLPDIWMCAPPLCNIIFPEQYTQINVGRNFDQEVTRVMIATPTTFLGATADEFIFNLKRYHFSPQLPDILGNDYVKLAKKSKGFILSHEMYSGPIPYIDWFADILQYDPIIQWSGGSILKNIHKEQEKGIQAERGITDNIPYLQHVANFTLARMRYQPRQGSVQMIFDPYLVAGVPTLIIDRKEGTSEHPTFWIGTPVQITHSISQDSAFTSVSLAYMHSTEEIDEIFACRVKKEKQVKAKKAIEATKDLFTPLYNLLKTIDYEAYISSAKLYTLLEQINPQDYPENVRPQIDTLNAIISSYNQFLQTKDNPTEEEISIRLQPARTCLFNIIASISNFYPISTTYKYVTTSKSVWSTIPLSDITPETESSTIPFEYQVFPPWLSPCYLNTNIGKIYTDLYGVSSIIDWAKHSASEEPLDSSVLSTANTSLGLTQELFEVATQGHLSVFTASKSIFEAYLIIKQSKPERVSDFITTLKRRPIASLEDIFGTSTTEGFHTSAISLSEINYSDILNAASDILEDAKDDPMFAAITSVTEKEPVELPINAHKDRKLIIIEYLKSISEASTVVLKKENPV